MGQGQNKEFEEEEDEKDDGIAYNELKTHFEQWDKKNR